MKWLTTTEPETGYLVSDITEQRLDGFSKLQMKVLGKYTALSEDTVHVVIPLDYQDNLHEVLKNIPDAKDYIQNHVLSTS